MDRDTQSRLATHFKSLHEPGKPVILANVHDAPSAQAVASTGSCRAVATASWAIAASQGLDDNSMPLAANLAGIRHVVRGVANAGKTASVPVSADLQDGYGDVAASVRAVLELGVVGVNLEDVDNAVGELRGVEDAKGRVAAAVRAAREVGVEDFVVNARTDVWGFGGSVEDVIERGRAYLDAGATAVFVWRVFSRHLTLDEVERICRALGGRVSVHGPGPTPLSVDELRRAGVCRVSVGPYCYRKAMEVYAAEAKKLLDS